MKLDKKAKHYVYGNGRFDLMTDEEIRTLTSSDIMRIYAGLSAECPGGISCELAHQLYELHLRYPDKDFRLEVLPPDAS